MMSLLPSRGPSAASVTKVGYPTRADGSVDKIAAGGSDADGYLVCVRGMSGVSSVDCCPVGNGVCAPQSGRSRCTCSSVQPTVAELGVLCIRSETVHHQPSVSDVCCGSTV